MKKIITIVLAALMLLSLAACAAEETQPTLSPEEQAFEAACSLMEEGKYQEAIDAFSALESYRKIQKKIDEAQEALENQKLAEEAAVREAELKKIRHLLGTWKSSDGTIELTFQENMFCHYREWMEPTMTREIDYAYTLHAETAYLEAFPVADPALKTDLGFPITVEDRDGIAHLLIAGYDFTRIEE